MDDPTLKTWDVAISYASENRDFAVLLRDALKRKKVSVFFDQENPAVFVGLDIEKAIEALFAERSRLVVLLVCRSYEKKIWPRRELRIAVDRLIAGDNGTVLPILMSKGVKLRNFPRNIGYLSWPKHSVDDLAQIIREKCRQLDPLPAPEIPALLKTIHYYPIRMAQVSEFIKTPRQVVVERLGKMVPCIDECIAFANVIYRQAPSGEITASAASSGIVDFFPIQPWQSGATNFPNSTAKHRASHVKQQLKSDSGCFSWGLRFLNGFPEGEENVKVGAPARTRELRCVLDFTLLGIPAQRFEPFSAELIRGTSGTDSRMAKPIQISFAGLHCVFAIARNVRRGDLLQINFRIPEPSRRRLLYSKLK